jgi:acyl carrier protein
MTPLEAISDAIRQVLRDTGRETGAIAPTARLAGDLGLDSLDLAQTIVLLERSLGVDPFRDAVAAARPSVRTVSDLVVIYTQHLSSRPTRTKHP